MNSSATGRILHILWFAALLAALLFAAFGLYARHVMASAEMTRLEQASASYSCIGPVLDPTRPRVRPETWIARFYLWQPDQESVPSLSWRLHMEATIAALDWSRDATRLNRMFAAVPMGGSGDFDHVALAHSGRHFCQLDQRHRQAIRDFFRSGRIEPLDAAFAQSAPA
jgi:hypothetical protein